MLLRGVCLEVGIDHIEYPERDEFWETDEDERDIRYNHYCDCLPFLRVVGTTGKCLACGGKIQ